MKKLLLRILIAAVVLLIVAALAIRFFLDAAVKRGVETVGRKVTKVDVKLEGVNLSILSGSGKIKGLLVGNPEGFKTPSAIQVGTASLALKPGSLLSDKIIVRSINLEAPEITLEGGLQGNNLSKILANVESVSGGEGETTSEEQTAGKKIQVDDFLITGAKVHVSVTTLGGKSATVTIPQIHLTNLGTGPEGITPADLTKKVLQVVVVEATKAASSVVTDLGTKSLGTNTADTVQKATKGIGDLFKKKKKE